MAQLNSVTQLQTPLHEKIQDEVYRARGLISAVRGLECLDKGHQDGVVFLLMAHEERLQALADKA